MLRTRIIPSKPVLILEGNEKNIVVTDLHIGFENSLASNEIFIGKNTSINETIKDIVETIRIEKPDSVILLGDIKSNIKNISKNEWNDVPLFFEKIQNEANVIVIPGNHDSNIQKLVSDKTIMTSSAGMILEDTLLTHGHTMPSENYSHVNKIIMGHVHPVYFNEESVLNGQRVWVSLKTDKQIIFPDKTGEIEITIIPSFNRYFFATQKKKHRKSISPIIERIKNMSTAKIVTLDGTIIGNESIIDEVL